MGTNMIVGMASKFTPVHAPFLSLRTVLSPSPPPSSSCSVWRIRCSSEHNGQRAISQSNGSATTISMKRCLRCNALYDPLHNSPTACSFHGHVTGIISLSLSLTFFQCFCWLFGNIFSDYDLICLWNFWEFLVISELICLPDENFELRKVSLVVLSIRFLSDCHY